MNVQSYYKTIEKNDDLGLVIDSLFENSNRPNMPYSILKLKQLKNFLIVFVCFLILALPFCASGKNHSSHRGKDVISLIPTPLATTSSVHSTIAIPENTVKANPFMPSRDLGYSSVYVPTFDIVEPPDTIDENSDAARVMDTIVSGILYDKNNSSAILNIEGTDYLVKQGDVVNNYKVIDISKDSVTVKLAGNTYKAGIGEILTEGDINYNQVSNLDKKFGGERK